MEKSNWIAARKKSASDDWTPFLEVCGCLNAPFFLPPISPITIPFPLFEMDFRVDIIGNRAEVVLNNPLKLNMLSVPWALALGSIFEKLDQDPNVRVILIWAEGRMFCAGLDLSSFSELLAPSGTVHRSRLFVGLEKIPPLARGSRIVNFILFS